MTNKIASEVLKASSIQQMSFCKVIVDGKAFSVKEALDDAIKTLEKEPCDDCISRQAVLALPTSKTRTLSGKIVEEEVNIELIKALPSVTPKEKTGHWIPYIPDYDTEIEYYVCSECKNKCMAETRYCYDCGAKMVERSGEE